MASLEQLEPAIAAKCTELGCELIEARFFRAGARSILRLFIYKSSGVTVDDCELVSREVDVVLEAENFNNGNPYTLEVSSPGIDRPLKTERDFKRIIGKAVVVNLREPLQGKMVVRGTLQTCENNMLSILSNETSCTISLDSVLSGKEEIQFK